MFNVDPVWARKQEEAEKAEYNSLINRFRELEGILGLTRADLDGKSFSWLRKRIGAMQRAIRQIKPITEVDFEPHTIPFRLGDFLSKRQ